MKRIFLLLVILVCWSCAQDPTERKQYKRNNIINVKDRIQEIVTDPVLIGASNACTIVDSFLVITDYRSPDMLIHLFGKNTFRYATSAIPMGQGPGEIANIGYLKGIDDQRRFYVNDHGRQQILSYDLDSILANPYHIPEVKMRMDNTVFPDKYEYINDTLSIGVVIKPTSTSTFQHLTARFNMNTGVIETMKYEHPEIERKRVSVAVSLEHGLYVEVYWYNDLFTVCSLDGELMFNVYGRQKWNNRMSIDKHYFQDVRIYNDKFISAYSDGGDNFERNETTGEVKNANPTQLIIFDLQGNYHATLDVGYEIRRFCCDEENNRIIFSFDDEIQFGYLSLDGLID